MITYLLTRHSQEFLQLKKKKVQERKKEICIQQPSWFLQAGRYAAKGGNYCKRPFASCFLDRTAVQRYGPIN